MSKKKKSSTESVPSPPRRRSAKFETGAYKTLLLLFYEEARESLATITSLLLSTNEKKPDQGILLELMRLTHGLKGAAGTIDLPTLAHLIHEYESIIEHICFDSLPWSRTIKEELLTVADQLLFTISESMFPQMPQNKAKSLALQLETLKASAAPLAVQKITRADTAKQFTSSALIPVLDTEYPPAQNQILRIDLKHINALLHIAKELSANRIQIEKEIQIIEKQCSMLLSPPQKQEQKQEHRRSFTNTNHVMSEHEQRWRQKISLSIEALTQHMQALKKTESDLYQGLSRLSTQSVHGFFRRMQPQLRTIARQAKKQVSLIITGEDIEFDKQFADQLTEPWGQLLRNAIVHGIESPAIRSQRKKKAMGEIRVCAKYEEDLIVIEISDDGHGIDIEGIRKSALNSGHLDKKEAQAANNNKLEALIFLPSFSTKKDIDELSGRGMGLSLVRETVSRLGGSIEVSSIPGQGTSFIIKLPPFPPIVNAPSQPTELTRRYHRRILVVDDSQAVRSAMRHILEAANYQVTVAADGQDAWTQLQDNTVFDYMLTDLEMPDGDGFTLLRRLHDSLQYDGMKVLILSSQTSKENRKQARALGAIAFLAKPVNQEQLMSALALAEGSPVESL